MRVGLALPPATQLNTPYPSVSYLARALREAGYTVLQADLGLQLMRKLFSAEGLSAVFDAVEAASADDELPEPAWDALAARDRHQRVIGPVVGFLAGRDRTLARRILAGGLLPQGPRVRRARRRSRVRTSWSCSCPSSSRASRRSSSIRWREQTPCRSIPSVSRSTKASSPASCRPFRERTPADRRIRSMVIRRLSTSVRRSPRIRTPLSMARCFRSRH